MHEVEVDVEQVGLALPEWTTWRSTPSRSASWRHRHASAPRPADRIVSLVSQIKETVILLCGIECKAVWGRSTKAVAVLDALADEPPGPRRPRRRHRAPAGDAHRHHCARGPRPGAAHRDGRFALGLRLVALGRAAADQLPLADVARPALAEPATPPRSRCSSTCATATAGSASPPSSRPACAPSWPWAPPCPRPQLGPAGSLRRGWGGSRPWLGGERRRARGRRRLRGAPVRATDGAVVAAVSVSGPIERTGTDPGARYGAAVVRRVGDRSRRRPPLSNPPFLQQERGRAFLSAGGMDAERQAPRVPSHRPSFLRRSARSLPFSAGGTGEWEVARYGAGVTQGRQPRRSPPSTSAPTRSTSSWRTGLRQRALRGDRPGEGPSAWAPGRGRDEALSPPPSTGRSPPAAVPPGRRRRWRADPGHGHQRRARGAEQRHLPAPGVGGGGHRRRGDLRVRGGPPDPPRRPCRPCHLRQAVVAGRHRRRQHRRLLVGEQGEAVAARSLKLGAIRLTHRFFDAPGSSPARSTKARRYIRSNLVGFAGRSSALGFGVAVGSSGTIEAIAAMANARRGDAPLQTYNNFAVSATRARCRRRCPRGRAPVAERRRCRVSTPPGPTSSSAVPDPRAGRRGVRDRRAPGVRLRLARGRAARHLQRLRGRSLHHLSDLRRRSVDPPAALMDDDPDHSARTARFRFALRRDRDRHGPRGRPGVPRAAALLCNVGCSSPTPSTTSTRTT